MEVVNHGQIERMTIPDGWVEGPRQQFQGIGTRSLREFHPPEAPEAQICLFYRGLPVDDESGEAFLSILGAPEHILSPEETASLRGVLKERADEALFELVKPAQTTTRGGRKALVLEGVYKQTKKYLHELVIAADAAGRVIQEIYFLGSQEDYYKYGADVQAAFNSIEWKVPVQA
ncbi:MAG TPA: hypothetical protein V6D08_18180 [Candidatus Obscuribacterales bacterium]